MDHKIIVLVTGAHCSGKDYCTNIWVSAITSKGCTSSHTSISYATKKEYAAATGADLRLLLNDRAYKEHHRPAILSFYQSQVQHRPQLPQEHFLQLVNDAGDVDVQFITGMRDDAPVATFSPLVPGNRLLEMRVQSSEAARMSRGASGPGCSLENGSRPDFIFDNNSIASPQDARTMGFAYYYFLPLVSEEMKRLGAMVRSVPNFPAPGINFRHVLNIAQQEGGLRLCTRIMEAQFRGVLGHIQTVVSVETGGLVFVSALVQSIGLGGPNLSIIRKQGKVPPPSVSTSTSPSHISSSVFDRTSWTTSKLIQTLLLMIHPGSTSGSEYIIEKRLEMDRDVILNNASVLVVDDVLATGNTLCAVLRLLVQAGVNIEKIQVMVVAEFPIHGGRKLLCERGFGRVKIQSLLVFAGF